MSTDGNRRLRPIQAAAGKLMSVQDVENMVAEMMSAPPEPEPIEVDLSGRIDLDEDDEVLHTVGPDLSVPAEDMLLGPMAVTYSAEDRHLAAWALYRELAGPACPPD